MQWIFEEHYKWEAVLIIKYIEKEKKRALQMRYNEQFVVEKLHLLGVFFFFNVSYIVQKSLWLFVYAKKNIIIQSVQISFA